MNDEQRREALNTANFRRSAIAILRREIRTGRTKFDAVLRHAGDEPESAAGRMRIDKFLKAVPKLGAVKIEKIIRTGSFTATRRLGELPPGRRETLAGLIAENMPKRKQEVSR